MDERVQWKEDFTGREPDSFLVDLGVRDAVQIKEIKIQNSEFKLLEIKRLKFKWARKLNDIKINCWK